MTPEDNAALAPPARQTELRTAFRRDIEGLRALAILLVVAYHSGIPGTPGGYVGVDVFFVLSGYLITGLLVAEVEATGKLDLARFYARRVRRLLPALTVVLVATIALGIAVYSPAEQRGFATTAVSTAAYVSNLQFARMATDYLGAAASDNPLLHTWSLSVEEQFYFVWPLLIFLGMGATSAHTLVSGRRRVVLLMTGATVVSFGLSLWLTSVRQPWAFFLSPLRSWEFGAGGLAALVPPVTVFPFLRKRRLASGRVFSSSWLGWAGVAGILLSAAVFDAETPYPGTAAVLPVLATIAALRAGKDDADAGVARMLGREPLQVIGRLSYSWYLWHWPVLIFATAWFGILGSPERIGLMLAALVLAAVSYRFIENPIRHSRMLARRPLHSLAMGALLTVFSLGLSVGWRRIAISAAESKAQRRFTRAAADVPDLYALGCHADYYDVDATGCTFGAADAPATLVLLGDSHAAQWFPALLEVTRQKGWRLVSLTKSACPIMSGSGFNAGIGRKYAECAEWQRNAVERIGALRPEIIVTSSYEGIFDRYAGSNAGVESSDPLLKDTANIFDGLGRSGALIVRIKDNPTAGFEVPSCLARAAWRSRFGPQASCEFSAQTGMNQRLFDLQARATRKNSQVVALDMTDQICPGGTCAPEQGGVITYRDTSHLTATFVQSLAPALGSRLEHLVSGQKAAPGQAVSPSADRPGTR